MKLLKDAAVQGDVSNLIIFGAYGSLPENQILRKYRYIEIICNLPELQICQ
jgi:hypothetical protein